MVSEGFPSLHPYQRFPDDQDSALRNMESLGEVSLCTQGRTGWNDVGALVEGRAMSRAEGALRWRLVCEVNLKGWQSLSEGGRRGVDSRRQQYASCMAVCLLPSCLCIAPAALLLGSVWAWAAGPASPWAKDLGCMSCPVPGGQLSWTRVHDLWSSVISLNHSD